MASTLPDLSRFELQLLRRLWDRRQASVRDLHRAMDDPPSYSTVRKIVERLEEKGAIERCGRDGNAWVYRSTVPRRAMLRKEIRRFLDAVFEGSAAPLVSHLAEMKETSLEDLKEIEGRVKERGRRRDRKD